MVRKMLKGKKKEKVEGLIWERKREILREEWMGNRSKENKRGK